MPEESTTPDLEETRVRMMALSNRREFDAVLAEFRVPDGLAEERG
jgi:hypothetical protein